MKRLLPILLILSFILFTITACDDSSSADSEPSFLTVLEEKENLTLFTNSFRSSGLSNTLEEGGPYTIFAPTNGAAQFFITTSIQELFGPELAEVIRFHVKEGEIPVDSFETPATLETLANGQIYLTRDDSGELRINVLTKIVDTIPAPNGTIYVVDRWFVPDEYNIIYTNVVLRYFLSAFIDAVKQTDDIPTTLANGNRTLTVFVPTNEAFEAAADQLAGLTDEQLRDILLNHIVESRFLSSQISGEVEFSTLNEGSSINLSVQYGNIIINDDAMVTIPDNDGVNGVFHVIDSVLFPDME